MSREQADFLPEQLKFVSDLGRSLSDLGYWLSDPTWSVSDLRDSVSDLARSASDLSYCLSESSWSVSDPTWAMSDLVRSVSEFRQNAKIRCVQAATPVPSIRTALLPRSAVGFGWRCEVPSFLPSARLTQPLFAPGRWRRYLACRPRRPVVGGSWADASTPSRETTSLDLQVYPRLAGPDAHLPQATFTCPG